MTRSTYSMVGLAVGIGLGVLCGWMIFDQSIYSRITKKMRKTTKALKRQQAEWLDAAGEVLNRGQQELDHVRDKGKRVYHELAS